MPTDPLKPCPFCGSQDLDATGDGWHRWHKCKNCFARGPRVDTGGDMATYDSRSAALWNKREPQRMSEPKVVIHTCGPSTAKCVCKCPESCEHKWDGPNQEFLNGVSVTCSRCGMTAIQHAMWVCP